MRVLITRWLDVFYPLFKGWMPLLTYRYAACGGFNTLAGLAVYYVGYHLVFHEELVDLGVWVFKPHMAALFLSGLFSFIVGFVLNKYIVFTDSSLRGRVQLFRYFLTFSLNLGVNYLLLKALVEYLSWEAFPAQLATTAVVITVGYLSQRYFTFKVR